jgi:hypothetical protein
LKDNEERVLKLTINIPSGNSETIEIRETDNIERIANDFCIKHELDNTSKEMLLENVKQIFLNNKKEEYVTERSAVRNKLATARINKKSFLIDHLTPNGNKAPIFERLYANKPREMRMDRRNVHCCVLHQKVNAKTIKRNTAPSKSKLTLKQTGGYKETSKEEGVKSVVENASKSIKKNTEVSTSSNRFLALYEDAVRRQKRSHTQERNFVTALNTYKTNVSRNSTRRITAT